MRVKYFLVVLLCMGCVVSSFAIPDKDYLSMTDSDRIRLAVSYFEVGKQYKSLAKEVLATEYFGEAYKIEKDVELYYSGERPIPRKTIQFDWDSIFEDATADAAPADTTVSSSESDTAAVNETATATQQPEQNDTENMQPLTDGISAWFAFTDRIKGNLVEDAVALFSDPVAIVGSDVNITREELAETVSGWLQENQNTLPATTAELVCDTVVKIEVTGGNFFFPLKNGVFFLRLKQDDSDSVIFDAVSADPF